MKKYLLSLTTLALLLCEASFSGGGMAFAADFGTNLTYTISSNTLTISVKSGYTTGSMPYWTSSNYTTDRPWENSKTTITTVIINKGVKNIGSYAFYGCTSLATIKLGTSTTDTCSIDSIGTAAFTACSAVANVYCWESNGTRALAHWLSIGMANTTSNPFCASTASTKKFYLQSSNTTTITIPSGTTKVKQYVFYKTPATTIKFPSSVKYIGTYAVGNSTTLASVYFGTGSTDLCGVDTIMSSVFTGCTAIANVYCYGGIGKYLAIGMNSLSSSPFYASTAATKKFYLDGTSTTTITIPEGITEIKKYAFYKHSYLTKISLPSTVSSVGTYAFAYCTGLTDFVALPATPPSTTSYTFNNTTISSVNLYVASAAAATAYGAADRWKDFATRSTTFEGECGDSGDNITFVLNFAEHSLTLAGFGAMDTYGSSSPRAPWYTFKDDINTISIGSGITTLGAYAFNDCFNVTSVSIPTSVTTMASSVFDDCKALTSYSYAGTIANWLGITFSSSSSNPMYYVKKCFVNGSTEVKDLVVPNGTTAIGNYAFYQCSGLTSVTLPASLTSVGTAAFSTCTNIANTNFLGTIDQWCGITFPANTCNPAFFSKQLSINGVEQTDIYLSDELTEIKNYTFYANAALTSISVKNTTVIRPYALTNCSADIVARGELSADFGTGLHWSLLDGVLTISKLSGTGVMPTYSSAAAPWYPYRKSINKIIVEEGVTQIGQYAFEGFVNCSGVYLPSTLTQITNRAFDGSTGISYIVSPATTAPTVTDTQIGQSSYTSYAFNGIPTTALIYVPSGSESSYSTALTSHNTSEGWKRFSTFVPCVTFSGTCGATGNEANITWEYDPEDKSITISGTGAMADFGSSTAAPWNGLKTVIASLSVANGVTTIGKYAFYGCTAITAVNDLPSSITSIGYHSFENCTALTSFTIPQNVTKVGDSMLTGCSSLATVVWNAENCTTILNSTGGDIAMSTSWNPFCGTVVRNAITSFTFGADVEIIPNGLCYSMPNLTSVTIPASVVTIGNDAFKETGLTSIIIPNNVSSIGTGAFQSCTALANITLPSGITSISNNTFNGCTALTSLDIPAAVESIGNYAFKNCTGLTEMHSYNTTAPSTTSYTFDGLSSTAIKIYVPSMAAKTSYEADDYWDADLRTIIALGGYCGAEGHEEDVIWTYDPDEGTLSISGTGAMADYNTSDNRAPWYDLRSNLTKLVIEEGVTTIGANAFYAPYSFAEISFPASLEESKSASFATINGPTRVNYAGTLAQWCDIKYNALSSTPMNYGTPAFYANGTQITGTVTVPEGVDIIKGYTLINLGITNLYLPSTLDSIGSNAFDKNTGSLTNIYYAGSAANWCGVRVASSTSHPLYVAKERNPQLYCEGVKPTSVVVPAGVKSLNDYHFYNCQELTSVTISEDITAIGANTFKNCSQLATIVWNATKCSNFSGTSNAPFYNVRSQITSITFGSSVKRIPGYLCYGMNNASLKSISIPNSVDTIGNYAFKACSKLEEINFGAESSLTSLGSNAFENDSSLTNVVLPSKLREIKSSTFNSCNKLESITIPDSVKQMATSSTTTIFNGCTALRTINWNAVSCAGFNMACNGPNSCSYFTPFKNVTSQITTFNIGANVEVLPRHLCYGMSGLTSISLPEGLKTIGDRVFYGCTGLTSITIPSTVTSIGDDAFYNCTSLASVTSEASTPQTIEASTFASLPEPKKLYVPHSVSAKAAYRAASGWNSFTDANTFPKIVQFDLNGQAGDAIAPQYFDNITSKASAPSDPADVNYHTFGGWYENLEGTGSEFAFSTTNITEDKTLYAKWTENVYTFADTDTDNSKIAAAEGKLASSITIGRTIWKDGYYNSLCLPFDLSAEQIAASPLAGYKALKRLSAAAVTGEGEERVLNIQLEPISEINAGEPCFISYEVGENIVNPEFNNVTVTASEPGSIVKGDLTCNGLYASSNLGTATTNLFIGENNTLYWPAEGKSTIKGLRAYFSISPSSPAVARGMRVRFVDRMPTGIEEAITNDQSPITNKIIREGQLFILRDGKTYNAQGALIK